ncbi:hypothetical protein D9M71_63050 [compost metagenome]
MRPRRISGAARLCRGSGVGRRSPFPLPLAVCRPAESTSRSPEAQGADLSFGHRAATIAGCALCPFDEGNAALHGRSDSNVSHLCREQRAASTLRSSRALGSDSTRDGRPGTFHEYFGDVYRHTEKTGHRVQSVCPGPWCSSLLQRAAYTDRGRKSHPVQDSDRWLRPRRRETSITGKATRR